MGRCHVLLCLLTSVPVPAAGQPRFEERAQAAGLQFVHEDILFMGGGAAAFDVDLDGDDDLYVTGGMAADALFINDGQGNFVDRSEAYGITALTRFIGTSSVVTGDIDNDGRRELFVGTSGQGDFGGKFSPNLLLKFNEGTKRFQNIARQAGLADASFCMGAHFLDVNLDGLLDLYVYNYVEEPELLIEQGEVVGYAHQCGANRLYLNLGDARFEDVTRSYGLGNEGCALAASAADVDQDGDADLLVANDFGQWIQPNAFYQNQYPRASMTSMAELLGLAARMYAMGIAWGDVDEDLELDIYLTNIAENHLYVQQSGGQFREQAERWGVADARTAQGPFTTGWGTFFADVDNDSHLDLFVANGFVNAFVDPDAQIQEDKLFWGQRTPAFQDVSASSGVNYGGSSRGAIYADFNQDGQLDIVTVTNHLEAPTADTYLRYYENQSNPAPWIAFQLEGQTANRDGFGAQVVVHAGGRAFLRQLEGGGSHASQHASGLHVGLGTLSEVDSVRVCWPGGGWETWSRLAVNAVHKLRQGAGSTVGLPSQVERKAGLVITPTRDALLVSGQWRAGETVQLRVVDAAGRRVLQRALPALEQSLRIELGGLSPGLYILQLMASNGRWHQKWLHR